MKKLMALTVLAIAGVAFASSLSVPWFVDNAGSAAYFPPLPGMGGGVSSLVYLHNNEAAELVCSITYITQTGVVIGPYAPDNTFIIPAMATLAFRPVANDPNTVQGGQESPEAQAIPNRPSGTAGGNDGFKNGALFVQWVKGDLPGQGTLGAGSVQGFVVTSQYVPANRAGSTQTAGFAHWGTLLPPGV